MKLYLHNFLQDNSDGKIHYPLKIIPVKVEEVQCEFNFEMMQSFIKRIDFIALANACQDISQAFEPPEDIEQLDEDQLRILHHLLFEIEVVSGELVSPSGKHFPINSGIPDMSPQIGLEPQQEGNPEEEDAN